MKVQPASFHDAVMTLMLTRRAWLLSLLLKARERRRGEGLQ